MRHATMRSFRASAMMAFAGPDLLCLAGVELTQGAGIPPGERMGRFYQEGTKQRAACLADTALAVLLSGLYDRRIEAGVARHLFGPREAVGLPQDRPRGGRADEPHAGDRQQNLDGGDVGQRRAISPSIPSISTSSAVI